MIKKLDHVAIAVRDLGEAARALGLALGLKVTHAEERPDQGVKIAILPLDNAEIELLEPLDPQGGVARFLERRGEGLHHLCLEVEDVDAELQALAGKGVELIDRAGRPGVAGRIGFLHPRAARGVLIELAQKV